MQAEKSGLWPVGNAPKHRGAVIRKHGALFGTIKSLRIKTSCAPGWPSLGRDDIPWPDCRVRLVQRRGGPFSALLFRDQLQHISYFIPGVPRRDTVLFGDLLGDP